MTLPTSRVYASNILRGICFSFMNNLHDTLPYTFVICFVASLLYNTRIEDLKKEERPFTGHGFYLLDFFAFVFDFALAFAIINGILHCY
jgi:hypothetical protein